MDDAAASQLIPVGPATETDVSLVGLSNAAGRKAIRQRIQDRKTLRGWEALFTQWYVTYEKPSRIPEKEQLAAATLCAERAVGREELRKLKRSPAFKKAFQEAKSIVWDEKMREAKEVVASSLVKGMKLQHRMVSVADEVLQQARTEDGIDHQKALDVIRAATPMTNAMLERVLPKKTEGGTAPVAITIHLSAHQQKNLDATTFATEAVDADFEVISEESAA